MRAFSLEMSCDRVEHFSHFTLLPQNRMYAICLSQAFELCGEVVACTLFIPGAQACELSRLCQGMNGVSKPRPRKDFYGIFLL